MCNYVGAPIKVRSGHEKKLALLSKRKTESWPTQFIRPSGGE